tara:strand:- start:353 stop:493 length:141 start_codon:yes stop_codon:yes gene_type:complete
MSLQAANPEEYKYPTGSFKQKKKVSNSWEGFSKKSESIWKQGKGGS